MGKSDPQLLFSFVSFSFIITVRCGRETQLRSSCNNPAAPRIGTSQWLQTRNKYYSFRLIYVSSQNVIYELQTFSFSSVLKNDLEFFLIYLKYDRCRMIAISISWDFYSLQLENFIESIVDVIILLCFEAW